MTEKIARRGVRAPGEYEADPLDQVLVAAVATAPAASLSADEPLDRARERLAAGGRGRAPGVSGARRPRCRWSAWRCAGTCSGRPTRGARTVLDVAIRPVRYVYDDCTVRQAADHMVRHGVGRLPVVGAAAPHRVVGVITRSDVLSAFRGRLLEAEPQPPTLTIPGRRRAGARGRAEVPSDPA